MAGESTVPDGALVIGRAVTTPTLDGRIDATEWDRAGFGGFDFTGNATQCTTIYAMYTYAVGTNPLGVSKTHEYLLDFCVDPSLVRSHMVQHLLNDPPLLIVPPRYACATEVLGKIHPTDPEMYPVEEAGFNAMLKRMEYDEPEHRHWGLVNFGESYQSCYDDGKLYFYRTYQNAGYGIVNDFPRGYLRSGDRNWYLYAVRRTRHNRDLDHSHYGPQAGGQTEYDALNWVTHHAIQTFWTHRQYLLLDWYMTNAAGTLTCSPRNVLSSALRVLSQTPS